MRTGGALPRRPRAPEPALAARDERDPTDDRHLLVYDDVMQPSRVLATTLACSVLVALGASACGGTTTSPSSPGEAGATNERTCEALASSARDEVASTIEARRACSTSADCVEVSLAAACFDSCSRHVRAGAEAEIGAAKAKVNGAQCMQFTTQGCRLVVPPCAPPTPPSCDNGLCS
jgi:hypothetical protein